jgi:hypothetical protein
VHVTYTAPPPPELAKVATRVLGMNIGAKNYDDPAYQAQLARAAVVVLGFYPGWRGDVNGSQFAKVVNALKAANPSIQVGQYTVVTELNASTTSNAANLDVITKVNQEDWWLRNAAGAQVRWTAEYGAYDINFTEWSKPDANGLRYPQWLAKRNAAKFFANVAFDFAYTDNSMRQSRAPSANWKELEPGVDIPPTDSTVITAWRRGQAAYWTELRAATGLAVFGNPDNDLSFTEYSGQLDGAFIEAAIGKSHSLDTWGGWRAMWDRYRVMQANVRDRRLVALNAIGIPTDYARARYGLATALLGDGMFTFTDEEVGYSSVPWFDEYELRLGKAVQPVPTAPMADTVWARAYEGGLVLVNTGNAATAVTVPAGYRRFHGAQDPAVNDGSPAGTVMMPARAGLILVKS